MPRITLQANENKIFTNGIIYGTLISLAEGLDGNDFYEISQEEYEEILKRQEEELLSEP